MVSLTRSATRQVLVNELKSFGIRRASIFGSFRRGEDGPESDIDLIVEPFDGMSLLGLARLKSILEERTGRRVDLLTYVSIDPKLRSRVLADSEELI